MGMAKRTSNENFLYFYRFLCIKRQNDAENEKTRDNHAFPFPKLVKKRTQSVYNSMKKILLPPFESESVLLREKEQPYGRTILSMR